MNGFTNPNNYNYAAGQQNRFDNGKPIMDRPEEYEGFFYAQQDTGDRNKIRNLMTLALDNMHNGSYNNALDLFQELLRLDPENEGANYNAFLCRHKFPDIPTEKADIRTFKNQLLNDQLTDHFFVQAKKYARSDRKKSLNELEWRCREIYRLDEVRDLLRERNVHNAANLLHAIHGWLQNNSRVSLYPDYFQELQSELEYQNNYLTYCQEVGDPGTYIARMMQQIYPQELKTAKKLKRKARQKGSSNIIIDILFAVCSISTCFLLGIFITFILFELLNNTDSAIYKACNEFLATPRWAIPLCLASGLCLFFGISYITNVKSTGGVLARMGITWVVLSIALSRCDGSTVISITIAVVLILLFVMIVLGCLIKSTRMISNRIFSPARGRKFRSYKSNTIIPCEKAIRSILSTRWDSIIHQEDLLHLAPLSLEDSV